jgi:hypothetical protein
VDGCIATDKRKNRKQPFCMKNTGSAFAELPDTYFILEHNISFLQMYG